MNESGLGKQIEEMFQTEASVCENCGHFEHEHYWNGGGNPDLSGYDQCKHEGCKCVGENFKTKIIGYDESMVEIVNNLIAQAVQKALSEIIGDVEKLPIYLVDHKMRPFDEPEYYHAIGLDDVLQILKGRMK